MPFSWTFILRHRFAWQVESGKSVEIELSEAGYEAAKRSTHLGR